MKGMGKNDVLILSIEALKDEKFYVELLDEIEKGEVTPSMKASWILGTVTGIDKRFATRYANRLVALLKNATVGGVQRELLKSLYKVDINNESEGILVNTCFQLLQDNQSDLAVKYYCVKVIQRMLKRYPDLKGELVEILKSQQEIHTASWCRQSKKILAEINQKTRG